MTLSIGFNVSAQHAHANLVAADNALSTSISRLSSGLRITRAGDDPAAMVLANNLRHNLSGITQASQNSEEGVTMLQTAEGSMDQISSLLTRMRTLAVQAANSGVQDSSSLQALQDELDAAVASITRTADSASFGSKKLLQGGLADNALAVPAQALFSASTQNAAQLPGGIRAGSALTATVAAPGITLARSSYQTTLTTDGVTPAAGTAPLLGLIQNGQPLTAIAGGTVTIAGALGSRTLTLPANATINDFLAQVNAFSAQIGAKAAYDASTGALTVESTSSGAQTFTISSSDMTGAGIGLLDSDSTGPTNAFLAAAAPQTMQLAYTDAAGTARTVTLTQDGTSPGGMTFSNLAGGPEAAPPYTAFAPGAFTWTAKDTSGGTVGSATTVPAGSYGATRTGTTFIQTGALANQTTTIDIPDMRAAALGHTAGLAGGNLGSLQDLTTGQTLLTGDATKALTVIDAAISEVSAARGRLGAVQSNGLESTLSTLQSSITNLTSAESNLRDVDFAAESATYARNNIIYQAATAMLAQANQIPQTVLKMLNG
jgi:flagellin